jgi:hypothetical protein
MMNALIMENVALRLSKMTERAMRHTIHTSVTPTHTRDQHIHFTMV